MIRSQSNKSATIARARCIGGEGGGVDNQFTKQRAQRKSSRWGTAVTHHSLSFLSFLLLTCCWMATLLRGRSLLVRAQWIFPLSPIDRKSNCFSRSMTWTGFDASAAAAVSAGAAESLPCFAMACRTIPVDGGRALLVMLCGIGSKVPQERTESDAILCLACFSRRF